MALSLTVAAIGVATASVQASSTRTIVAATLAQPESFTATHYGISFQGNRLGCTGAGTYDTNDSTIAAVSPSRYTSWPCGTNLVIVGPNNPNHPLVVTRKDSCPGCHHTMIDLSEAGVYHVCGGIHTCRVTVEAAP